MFLPGGGRSPPGCVGFGSFPIYPRGGGKVENLLLVFHFSIRPRRRRCGNVESRPPLARFPRGSWEEWEALLLAFHSFHRPGISTALRCCCFDWPARSLSPAVLSFC